MRKIVHNLWQGNNEDAIKASLMNSVDYIVYLGQELPKELAFESNMPIIHLPLKDGEENPLKLRLYIEILYGLRVLGGKMLIACRGGISRSPIVTTVVLSECVYNQDFDEALRFVQSKIPEMQPELNLLTQFKEVITK